MGVIDNVKEVADLVQRMGNVDLYRKIMTLEEEIFQLARQPRKMVLKNEQLEETLRLKEKLEFKPPFYFPKGTEFRIASVAGKRRNWLFTCLMLPPGTV